MKHQTAARALSALVATAGLAAATLAVSAQTPPPGPPPAGAPGPSGPGMRMPANDAEFIRMLDSANTNELDQAKFVVNRTKDPSVHQFAQHMIDDHSTAAVKLEAATRGTNLRPTPRDDGAPPRGGARMLAMLQSESGQQLDNDYMRLQVPAHRRALGLLQWESQNGTVANLKTLATSLIPTVQQHLQMAQGYLAAHNLTPLTPPDVLPVPGNVNPNNAGAGRGPGIPNNPASPPNGGSTSGQGNASGGTQPNTAPVVGPTYQPLGSGTPPPGAGGSPAPAPSSSPRP